MFLRHLLPLLLCATLAASFAVPVNLECRKLLMKQVKRQVKLFSACTREVEARLKGDEEEFKKQFGCIVKCVMGKDGLLNAAGQVSEETAKSWMKTHVPSEMQEVALTLTSGCIEEFGPQMKNEDVYCSVGYVDYVNCISGLMADYC